MNYLIVIALFTLLNFVCERFLAVRIFGGNRNYWRALQMSIFQAAIVAVVYWFNI